MAKAAKRLAELLIQQASLPIGDADISAQQSRISATDKQLKARHDKQL